MFIFVLFLPYAFFHYFLNLKYFSLKLRYLWSVSLILSLKFLNHFNKILILSLHDFLILLDFPYYLQVIKAIGLLNLLSFLVNWFISPLKNEHFLILLFILLLIFSLFRLIIINYFFIWVCCLFKQLLSSELAIINIFLSSFWFINFIFSVDHQLRQIMIKLRMNFEIYHYSHVINQVVISLFE